MEDVLLTQMLNFSRPDILLFHEQIRDGYDANILALDLEREGGDGFVFLNDGIGFGRSVSNRTGRIGSESVSEISGILCDNRDLHISKLPVLANRSIHVL